MILILILQGYSVQVHNSESFKDTGKKLKLDLNLQKKYYHSFIKKNTTILLKFHYLHYIFNIHKPKIMKMFYY